jgi:uncharacterized coiled-coil protein SlyX
MYHTDAQGRRRSARTQGLPPPSPSNTPPIDFLTDNNYAVRSNDTPSSLGSLHTDSNTQSEKAPGDNDDLLSFADYFPQPSEHSSDNLLSMTNSHQSDSSTWPTMTLARTNDQMHHMSPQDETIEQLQQTIKLLTDRLGRLEQTNVPPPITSSSPVKPSPPQSPVSTPLPMTSEPIQPNELTIKPIPTRRQIDPPSKDSTPYKTEQTNQSDITTTNDDSQTVVVLAPDPPEDYVAPIYNSQPMTPVMAIATMATTTTVPIKSTTAANREESSASPHQVQITTAPPAPSIQPIMYAKDQKLSFSTYKQTTDYSHWKALCLLEAYNNSKYTSITTKVNNKYVINSEMTENESTMLYLATMKALGSHAFNIISIEDTEEANGIELWKSLDEYFDEKEESTLLKHDIKRAFETLSRENNESIDNYRVRFEKQLHLLKLNNMTIPSRIELVYQFLTNMKVAKVFDDIIMQIDTEDKFFRNLTWKQLCTKSKKQIKLYMKIHPDSNVFGTPPKQQPKK